jgi:hypothetical protein
MLEVCRASRVRRCEELLANGALMGFLVVVVSGRTLIL